MDSGNSQQDFYRSRTADFRLKADGLQKKSNQVSWARLLVFAGGIVSFFILINFSVTFAFVWFGTCMVAFGGLIKYHSLTEQRRNFYRYLETINSRESAALDGNYYQYPEGSEYRNPAHENSFDLDLFGHASVFQFLNRTTSRPASDMLAEWLKAPAPIEVIKIRQEACVELKDDIEWRQELIALGYQNPRAASDPSELIRWGQSDMLFVNRSKLRALIILLSGFAILSTLSVILFSLPAGLLIIPGLTNFIFYFSFAKNIGVLHNQVGKYAEMLGAYSSIIKLIEERNFESDRLRQLHGIFAGDNRVSENIKQLSKLVGRLDSRLNIMISIPLNFFFFRDIQCCLALEKWKESYAGEMPGWFEGMAEFEVLSSFANTVFNNPDWVLPVIVPGYFVLNARDAGHPLIPSGRRITNNLEVTGSGKAVIITGSNMSGKSTFLRTIGVNAVLAFAGAPVCAAVFTLSHMSIFSSMRISDSLEDNTSSFYAELKRLASIINEAERNPRLLLLLDEILRGTNSNDRYTGSVALLKQLIGYQTVSFLATHDLKLAGLEEELPGKIDNYHFDVKIDGEELYFDYILNHGVCRSMNASILMKKMGIRLE